MEESQKKDYTEVSMINISITAEDAERWMKLFLRSKFRFVVLALVIIVIVLCFTIHWGKTIIPAQKTLNIEDNSSLNIGSGSLSF